MTVETELKLRIAPQQLAPLKRFKPHLTVRTAQYRRDAPESDLRESGILPGKRNSEGKAR